MNVIPFSKFIINANQKKHKVKNATGLVENWELLLNDNAIEQLRQSHNGVFAYLGFDVTIDKDIFEYIECGALSAESGDELIILYSVNKIVEAPFHTKGSDLIELLKLRSDKNNNIEIIKSFFENDSTITIPGLLIFDNVAFSKKHIYISFIGQKNYTKIDCLRKIISFIAEANSRLEGDNESVIDKISTKLSLVNMEYLKSSRYTFSECIIKAFRLLMQVKSDLISIFV